MNHSAELQGIVCVGLDKEFQQQNNDNISPFLIFMNEKDGAAQMRVRLRCRRSVDRELKVRGEDLAPRRVCDHWKLERQVGGFPPAERQRHAASPDSPQF